jgi:hypothetical protein
METSLGRILAAEERDHGFERRSPVGWGSVGVRAEGIHIQADGEALLGAGKVDEGGANCSRSGELLGSQLLRTGQCTYRPRFTRTQLDK